METRKKKKKDEEESYVPTCYWCGKPATTKDYRDIDGCVSKILSCDKCVGLSTSYLLRRIYNKKK